MPALDQTWLAELARKLDPLSADGPYAAEKAECESLSAYTRRAWPSIEPGTEYLHNWHIDAIAEHLEAVSAGQILRLLINMPPRHMKTIAVSVMWPTWEWTQSAFIRYMFVTYSGELSKDQAIARRAVVQSDWYRDRWGDQVRLTSDNIMSVSNAAKGVFAATSMTGTATGRGANRLVFDDPHNPKQAESEVERKTDLNLFNTTFPSRLNDKKRDAIVCVMQRLHEEDIAARCIELGYVHLCLPAEAEGRTVISLPSGREIVREDGALLWPEREGPAELKMLKDSMGSYGYAGQYQQRPAPAGGGMFTSFPIVHAVPADARRVRYWDKAGTANGGAYTAGVKVALTKDRRFIIEHVVRGQWSAGEREKVIRTTTEADGRTVDVWVEQEPGSGGKESAENTVKLLAGFNCFIERVTGDKESRARPMAAQAEIGNVYLLEGPWNQAFVDEARAFPNGKYKDQIDAGGGGFNKLALIPLPGPTVAAMPAPLSPVPRASGGLCPGVPRWGLGR